MFTLLITKKSKKYFHLCVNTLLSDELIYMIDLKSKTQKKVS